MFSDWGQKGFNPWGGVTSGVWGVQRLGSVGIQPHEWRNTRTVGCFNDWGQWGFNPRSRVARGCSVIRMRGDPGVFEQRLGSRGPKPRGRATSRVFSERRVRGGFNPGPPGHEALNTKGRVPRGE